MRNSFADSSVRIEASLEKPYPDTLRRALLNAVATPVDQPIDNIGSLDRQVGGGPPGGGPQPVHGGDPTGVLERVTRAIVRLRRDVVPAVRPW